MAKYNFNDGTYARFFADRSNQRFLQTFLDTAGVIYTNYGWYKTQARKADMSTPIAGNGAATYTVKSVPLTAAPAMDMRAPLSETLQADEKGIDFYTGAIPHFSAKGYVETAIEREAKLKQFEIFGNDADIVAAWTAKVQTMVDSADTTLNLLTARLISTGKCDYSGIGEGIQGLVNTAKIPEENFVKAGEKVWTDTTCKILTQMAAIEAEFRENWGYTGSLVWQLPRKMFYNVLLKNAEVRSLVSDYRQLNYIASTPTMVITEQMFNDAIADYEGLSPIEIVTERTRNVTATTDTMIHGWDENVAVLRPAGYACEIEYTDNVDRRLFEKFGSKIVDKVFASTNDGLGTLVNTTISNGTYQEWHTDLFMDAVPALLHFPHHVIVKTNQANS